MSDREHIKDYPDSAELYRLKESHRKSEAKRPISEKMATVARLRDLNANSKTFAKPTAQNVRPDRSRYTLRHADKWNQRR